MDTCFPQMKSQSR